MSLTERSRATLYRRLSDLIHDEEAVGEMLSNFPAHGTDEPATRDLVRAEIGTVRTEIGQLRTEFHRETGALHTEVEKVRTEIQSTANRIIIWAVGANVAMLGLVLTVTRAT